MVFFLISQIQPLPTATIIYPATQKLINKYTHKNKILVKETPEIYQNIVLPYLKESQNSNNWIYNILEGKSEQERTIFHDKDPKLGFLLAPSMNWPGEIETLYLNTLTMDRNIMHRCRMIDRVIVVMPFLIVKKKKVMLICERSEQIFFYGICL